MKWGATAVAAFAAAALLFGACESVDTPPTDSGCPSGLSNCAGECVDIQHDRGHCGHCAHECAANESCTSGVCTDGCGFGELACEGTCVSPATDPLNCGGCGLECGPEQLCTSFHCACLEPQLACDEVCVDVMTDAEHCGGCENACLPGRACVDGQCASACATGFTSCGSECVDTLVDVDHCGACDVPCSGQTASCVDGNCTCALSTCGFCRVNEIGPGPQTIGDTTLGTTDTYESACGLSAPARAYHFVAPWSATYRVEATGTGEPHVLSVIGMPGCTEQVCDSGNGVDPARLTVPLAEGQEGLVVISGVAGESIDYELNVWPIEPCVPQDVGSTVPQVLQSNTFGTTDVEPLSCSPFTGSDAVFQFTAPATGTYAIGAQSISLNAVSIEVRTGDCLGPVVACKTRDAPGAYPTVLVPLQQGQVAVIFVEGLFLGEFELRIDQAPHCPGWTLAPSVPQTVSASTVGRIGVMEALMCPMSWGPEVTYEFTPEVTGDYTFDTFGSDFDTVLYVRDGSCNGPELACNDNDILITSRLTVGLTAGQPVVVVVDGPFEPDQGNVSLNVSVP